MLPGTIRRATLDDLAEVMALVHEYDPATPEAAVVPLLADDTHGVIWLAPGAYAVVTWGWSLEGGGPEALLDEVYVRHRNAGTGSALLEHLHADCARRGMRRIYLETEAGNSAGRRLYARHGYVVEDSVWLAKSLL